MSIITFRNVDHLYWVRTIEQYAPASNVDQLFLPWCEVVAAETYTVDRPMSDGIVIGSLLIVSRLWFLDVRGTAPNGLTIGTDVKNAVSVRSIGAQPEHPNKLADNYAKRPKQLTPKQRTLEETRFKLFQQYWSLSDTLRSNLIYDACDENELVLQAETDVVWTEDVKQLPFVCEILCGVADAAPTLPHKRVVGYSVVTQGRARVFYLPHGCDLTTTPRGHRAVVPASVVAGQPSKLYRGRWLPVSRKLKERFR